MASKVCVLDANVFLEYIFGRKLSDQARRILRDAILERIEIVLPCLVLDEITEVLCANVNEIEAIAEHLRYLENLALAGVLNIVVPNTNVRRQAVEMARVGNKKSGYPEFTDCLYHALAILTGATFITNDKKHIAKVRSFGHIQALSDYQ